MADIFQYRGPWAGTDVSQPEVNLEPNATPYSNNFEYVLGELRTRGSYLSFPNPGVIAVVGGDFVRSFFYFRDITFTERLVGICVVNLFSYNHVSPLNAGSITLIGTPANAGEFRPLIPAVYNGVLYYPSGPCIISWDGTTFVNPSSNICGGKFIGTLASHLIVLNTTEAGPAYFPQRVRWSASGLPTVFDPTVNTNAGYVDLDVPDAISGFVSMGTIGWVMRTDGITQMIPTGNGLVPFAFYPLLSAPVGVGNYYPWSLDSFGLQCAFVSRDDIYAGNPQGVQAIGGKAREAIFVDIFNAPKIAKASPYTNSAGTTFATACPVIIGSLVPNTTPTPRLADTNRVKKYILAIPNGLVDTNNQTGSIIYWEYTFADETWVRKQSLTTLGWQTSNIRTCKDPGGTELTYTIAGSVAAR